MRKKFLHRPIAAILVTTLLGLPLPSIFPIRQARAQDDPAGATAPKKLLRKPPRGPRSAPFPPLQLPTPPVGVDPGGPTGGAKADLPLPALPGEKEFTECRRIPPGKKVVVTLKPDSELSDLVGWIKTISCRPFIVPANIRQSKVTIVVPEAITANEAYRIFLSSLESMGLTIQPEGQVLKIIESSRARESPIPLYTAGHEGPANEQYVTRLLRLTYVYPEDVVAVLNRLKGRDGDITPYPPTNTLVITDLASNIRRMEEVVRALDVPMGGEKIWVIRLKNVAAAEVAQMLQQIFGVGAKGGAPASGGAAARRPPIQVSGPGGQGDSGGELSISQILPDERTNSLILVATERTYERVLALVKRLEEHGNESGGGSRVHVQALENANAEDMAAVLQGLGVSVGGARSTGGTSGGRGGTSVPTPAGGSSGSGGGGLFQEQVKVTADKATNSLVILAGGKDFIVLRDVIRRLDIPRRQVYIEAMVMEVSISKGLNLGASYHGAYDAGPGVVIGSLHSTTLNSLNPLGLAALSGLAAGVVGTPLPTTSAIGQLGQSIPAFGVVIQALQTNNDVNILQVPNILTTDNEKASIQVGQNLPFPASNFGLPGSTPGATGASFAVGTSVQRQDVALKLDITPHVNASDYVRLEIDNEISDVAADNYNGLGPATNKRTLKTVAVVRDQQPIVLGGILRDKQAETETKIPLLGDIPLLGYLFKIKQKTIDKQMLLIVLTPYIINDPGDLRRIFERKMKERREFIETYSVFKSEVDFDKVVDYSRKRGALEEVNRTALNAERDAMDLRAAEQGLRREVEAGPVELPVPPTPRGGHSGGGGGSGGAAALPPPPSGGPPPGQTSGSPSFGPSGATTAPGMPAPPPGLRSGSGAPVPTTSGNHSSTTGAPPSQ